MKKIVIACVAFLLCSTCFAQVYKLDVNVRFDAGVPMDGSEDQFGRSLKSPSFGLSGEVLYFPLNFLGVGIFHTRSLVTGTFEYAQGVGSSEFTSESKYKYAMYGASVQASTNRLKSIIGYGVVRIGNAQLVEEYDGFSVGNSGFAYGIGLGLMIKITHNISFNVLEASYTFLPKEFSLDNAANISLVNLQSGVSIKFMQVK